MKSERAISITMVNGDVYEFPVGDDWYERLEKVASREWLAFSTDSGQLVVLRASNIVAITSE